MTVKELIEKLRNFSGDLVIQFDCADCGLIAIEGIKSERYQSTSPNPNEPNTLVIAVG